MAVTVARLIVDLTARTTPFERSMRKIERSIDRTGRRFRDVGQKLTTAITLPLLAVGGAAIKAAIDFESAFAGVRKTVEATEAEFAALRKGILDMSSALPASANEIAGVAEAAGQLGISTENILGFTRTMVDLGETTNLSAAEAAKALARLANITGLPQDEFDRLGSSIVDLGNNFATTEQEIVQMALRLAGAGKQIGLSEANILAFATALSAVGIQAQAGGTAFSRAMVSISKAVSNGSKQLAKFAIVSGVSASEFKQLFEEDAAGAMVKFVEGLKRMKDEGKNTFIVLDELGLGEVRIRDALLRTSGASDLLRRAIMRSNIAWKENTALTIEANKRYATTASKLKVLKNQLIRVGIELGENLIPALQRTLIALKPLADKAVELVRSFSALEPATQQMIVKWTLFATALGPVLFIVGALISAFGGLFGIVATVAGGIVRLGAFIVGLSLKMGLIKAALPFWVGFKLIALQAFSAITIAGKAFITFMYGAAGPFLLLTAAVALWILNWEELKQGTIVIFNFLKSWVPEQFQKLKEDSTNILTGMVSALSEEFERIKNFFMPIANMKDKVIAIFQSMADVLVNNSIIPDMVNKIGAQFRKLRENMILPTSLGAKKVKTAFENLQKSGARAIGALGADLVKGAINFEQFAARAIKALIRLAAQQAALQFGPGGALIGGFVGGFFAKGGRPKPGMPNVVGEEGPEIFVPDTLGRITPLRELSFAGSGAAGGGEGGTTQIFNIQGMDFSDPRVIRKIMMGLADAARKGDSTAVKLFRRGGDLDRKNSGRSV